MKDRYLIIEGLDGIGKGVTLEAIKRHAREKDMRIFDLHDHWQAHQRSPDPAMYANYDVVITGEPRYAGTGADVRWWLANKDQRISARELTDLFSVDRKQHLEQIVHPALDAGVIVVQSRTFLSTCIYQPMMAQNQQEPELSTDEILAHAGNVLALSRPPSTLLIGTVPHIGVLEERFSADHREAADRFERLEFQAKLQPFYEDPELLSLFADSNVLSYDASVSVEHSELSAIDAFTSLLYQG